ncbi:MAG: MBL fold metallo-hydrolase [Candidatus Aenigmarchaeota archaeon]|nr:MBL fold metallo-hydrolase [Candidatus Aenigmarchaeota archaeon]
MQITSFGHSCLLVEEQGKRLLIDPGNLSFPVPPEPGLFGRLDAILLTHEHADHTFPEVLKSIIRDTKAKAITIPAVASLLRQQGLPVHHAGSLPLRLQGMAHGLLPEGLATPENTGFLIGGRMLHPGDSLAFPPDLRPEILALPVMGPWLTLREALAAARRLQPRHLIPIHDGFLKDPDFINRIIRRAWPQAPLLPLRRGEKVEL